VSCFLTSAVNDMLNVKLLQWVSTPGTCHAFFSALLLFISCLQQPLFPGDSEWQQLLHIFKLLGTPNENVWPGVSRLRDW